MLRLRSATGTSAALSNREDCFIVRTKNARGRRFRPSHRTNKKKYKKQTYLSHNPFPKEKGEVQRRRSLSFGEGRGEVMATQKSRSHIQKNTATARQYLDTKNLTRSVKRIRLNKKKRSYVLT